jgi:hypothetical protein
MSRAVVLNAVVVACSLSLLAACSTNSYCLVDQDYQKARVVPELRSADGLVMPNSPSALRLPPEPAGREPFGRLNDEGRGVCLDSPPAMAQPAAPPQATPKPAT